MPESASTRVSLLIRLRDNADADAWSQFVEIYSPLIFRFARHCQLQESDAADLVQEVMGEVTKSIARFEYDPQVGKFRSWLYKIAKRTIWRIQKKQARQPRGTGDSHAIELLSNLPDH
ncbi:MAG: sigma-70 family RNA polymerase sigma factor, partial [Planctomycetota bacterium]